MKKRLPAGLLALCILFSLTACGPKADATATSMRLMRTQGQVQVFDGAGAEVVPRESLGLYSGYGVDTRQESFAWINLDDVKLTKLDEDSEIEITKSGKSLELHVVSGGLFFNITEPLEDDETLNIRTSSMVVGIRGTCGWVTEDSVALLEGIVSVAAGVQSVTVNAGEMAVVTADGTLEVRQLTGGDIPAFVLAETEGDEALMGAVSGGPSAGDADVWWHYDEATRTLTIGGSGAMEDYDHLNMPWYGNRGAIQSVVIRPGVTSIGSSAFYSCGALISVDIPDGVTSIGDDAFGGCRSLTGVDIPDGVTSIGRNAFGDCRGLTSVTIPDSVTSIGDLAFAGCGSLTGVDIPEGVTSIGPETFDSCMSMASVTIPEGVTSIGTSAFHYCPGLTSVDIPGSVTSIGDFAFASCYSLASVTIPESVTTIGPNAFGSCGSLTEVYYTGTQTQWAAASVGNGNDDLLNAVIHYNSPG